MFIALDCSISSRLRESSCITSTLSKGLPSTGASTRKANRRPSRVKSPGSRSWFARSRSRPKHIASSPSSTWRSSPMAALRRWTTNTVVPWRPRKVWKPGPATAFKWPSRRWCCAPTAMVATRESFSIRRRGRGCVFRLTTKQSPKRSEPSRMPGRRPQRPQFLRRWSTPPSVPVALWWASACRMRLGVCDLRPWTIASCSLSYSRMLKRLRRR